MDDATDRRVADRLATLRRAASAGAALATDAATGDLEVELKAHATDYVTAADREVQRTVVELIEEDFPGETVVGEEVDLPETVPPSGPAWVVDPIDGTRNFVHDVPVWAVSVACVVDGEPVAAVNRLPATDTSYAAGEGRTSRDGDPASTSDATDPVAMTASVVTGWYVDDPDPVAELVRGLAADFGDVRRLGSAQSELSMVAAGQLDLAVSPVPAAPWDTVAGVHLVRRAGGTVTDLAGERWTHDSASLLATNGEAHEAVRARLVDRGAPW